jgi:hypothetical protein
MEWCLIKHCENLTCIEWLSRLRANTSRTWRQLLLRNNKLEFHNVHNDWLLKQDDSFCDITGTFHSVVCDLWDSRIPSSFEHPITFKVTETLHRRLVFESKRAGQLTAYSLQHRFSKICTRALQRGTLARRLPTPELSCWASYRIHNSTPLIPILCQMDLIRIVPFYSFN